MLYYDYVVGKMFMFEKSVDKVTAQRLFPESGIQKNDAKRFMFTVKNSIAPNFCTFI